MASKKKNVKKGSEIKSNGSIGELRVYKVNGNSKKQEAKPGKERAIKTFLIVIIVILSIAAVFAAIKTFFPDWFGRFTMQGELAARVNGKAITMEQLNAEYERLPLQYQYYINKEAFLTQLIDEMLLYDEAIRLGLGATDEEVDASLNEFIEQNNLTQESLDQILLEKKLTIEQLKSLIRSQLAVDKLIEQEVKGKTDVTAEMAIQYYNENPEAFTMMEMATARHILISIDTLPEAEAEAKAKDILAQIKPDNSNFCDLVTEHSDDPGSVDNCGEYMFPRGQMVQEFEDVAFGQDIDNISIVKTAFGYHIVWTVNKTPEQVMSFEAVEEQINAILEQQQQRMVYSDLIVSLREKADITNYLEQKAEAEAAEEELQAGEIEDPIAEAGQESTGGIAAPEIDIATAPIEEVEEAQEIAQEQEALEQEVAPAVEEVVEEAPVAVEAKETIAVQEPAKQEIPAVAMSFAECLTSKGAKLYGAYWDSSTKEQKEYFGVDAVKLTYIECGVQGDYRAQDKACEDAGIMAYPTWDINGQKHMGIQAISQLATLTGCKA